MADKTIETRSKTERAAQQTSELKHRALDQAFRVFVGVMNAFPDFPSSHGGVTGTGFARSDVDGRLAATWAEDDGSTADFAEPVPASARKPALKGGYARP